MPKREKKNIFFDKIRVAISCHGCMRSVLIAETENASCPRPPVPGGRAVSFACQAERRKNNETERCLLRSNEQASRDLLLVSFLGF